MDIQEIITQFLSIAKDFKGIKKIILFGSFAKNKPSRTSDIDIAISGDFDYYNLCERINNEIETLRSFDIVEYDHVTNTLKRKLTPMEKYCIRFQEFKRELAELERGRTLYYKNVKDTKPVNS